MAGNMTGILSKTRLSFCLISSLLQKCRLRRTIRPFPGSRVYRELSAPRGYGAAVSQAETESTKRTLKSKGKQEEEKATSESLSWVPDSITGYYKPSGQTNGPSGQISGPTGPRQEE
ncbi:uncharacterized protein [Nicotiana tomentosiformis]|uniref:uncharacterized protein n=1 Tax=Nicotiana tomentosiformis TaxID=4098 RepID=UPI00051BFEAE|nr:uncharacterized protein LOC104114115 isoform X1 [Nicotiana tomentosiformis]